MTRTAEVAALIERLNALAADAESNDDHGVKEACDKAAAALRTIQEKVALERARAEAAEAKLAEAMKVLAALDRVNRRVDWCDQYEQARRWSAARKFLKENGNGE